MKNLWCSFAVLQFGNEYRNRYKSKMKIIFTGWRQSSNALVSSFLWYTDFQLLAWEISLWKGRWKNSVYEWNIMYSCKSTGKAREILDAQYYLNLNPLFRLILIRIMTSVSICEKKRKHISKQQKTTKNCNSCVHIIQILPSYIFKALLNKFQCTTVA